MVDVVFLGINDIGQRVYNWLNERDDANVLALLTEPEQLSVVEQLEPSLIISAGFRAIVPANILEVPEFGAVNLHKSYLPYNRGANPNVWSIVEDGPAGVTIHYMTSEIDGGPIIDRRKVSITPDDTGLSLYERLEREQFEQFTDCWPAIRDDDATTMVQDNEDGTTHYKQDFVNLWHIDRGETVQAGEFLDRIRALTFPPFKNAYFVANGERYYVEVDITPEAEVDQELDREIPTYSEEDIP